VRLATESGKPISQLTKELDLTESTLRKWIKQAQIDEEAVPDGPLTTEERHELTRLHREVKCLEQERAFLKKAAAFCCALELSSCAANYVSYELIEAEKANYSIKMMCDAFEVARSGFYTWRNHLPSPHQQENAQLTQQIEEIYQESRQSYDAPRIHEALQFRRVQVGYNRVARLMVQQDFCMRPKRQFKITTDSNHLYPIAENVLNRNFTAAEPDQAWVEDITYIPTLQGWLYLAVILDVLSRRVIGWSLADHMRVDLVLSALQSALGNHLPAISGLVFHSDRGRLYASHYYQNALEKAGITCSKSRKGNCWDNSVAESFFGTLKTELIHPRIFATRNLAKTIPVEWIEVFYNLQRLHSTLGYLAPAQFEHQYYRSIDNPVPA
jgi:transposase InsO family protein/transposase-like protein